MRTNITGNHGIVVTGDTNPTVPHGGQLWWDNSAQKYVIRNEYGACDFYPQNLQVSLGPMEQTIIDWAERKMLEEKQLDELCAKHPGLNDAREAFEVMKALCK